MLYLSQKSKTPAEELRLEDKGKGFFKRRHYTETVYIIGDSLSNTVADVRADPNLPDLYEEYDNCYCVAISPKEAATIIHPLTGAPTSLWEVTIEWDSDIGTDSEPGDPSGGTPDNRAPQYKWTTESEEEAVYKDINGVIIATPAGEPIVITKPVLRPVLEIHRNEPFPFEPSVILDYAYHKNQSVFWGAPPGTCIMLPMETDYPFVEGGIVYVPVTYRIKFFIEWEFDGVLNDWVMSEDTAFDRPVCKGLYYYDTPEYDAWVAAGSNPATKPEPKLYANQDTQWNAREVFLDKYTGKKKTDQTTPHFMNFETLPDAEFDDLNLQPWWWSSTTTTTTTT